MRRRVALHEAAHVLAALVLEIPFSYVTVHLRVAVEPFADGGVFGVPMFTEPSAEELDVILLGRLALVNLAGPVAEELAGYPLKAIVTGYHEADAAALIGLIRPALGALEALRLRESLRACAITLCVQRWRDIQRITTALLAHPDGSLTRDEVIALLQSPPHL